MIIGDKDRFAFEIGDVCDVNIQKVDIWVAGILVTYVDNLVYIPQFIASLERELVFIENGEISDDYIALQLGPTTDNISSRFSITDVKLYVTCVLDSGNTIETSLPTKDMVTYYKTCISKLDEIK